MIKNTWKNKVIYHIFIDRYAGVKQPDRWQEPEYIGGNISGITNSLPYIKSLGVDVIWLSPFTSGVAYHGYHTIDFFSVDSSFGTESDLKELIDSVHEEGMKIICDFVPNHCSIYHPYFQDAITDPNSKYREWFNFKKWPYNYEAFLSVEELPKLNLDHQPVVEHMQNAARKWLQLGFDGLRLDHILGLSNENITQLLNPLREDHPDKVFIGEAWLHGVKLTEVSTLRIPNKYALWLLWKLKEEKGNDLLYQNYADILDGILDFTLTSMLETYVNTRSHSKRERYAKKIRRQSRKFNSSLLQFTFLDNHDIERFMYRCGNKTELLKEAANLQFSLDQPAIIYYGTEVGLTQYASFKSIKNHADILARLPMEWSKPKQDTELLNFYKKLIKKKKNM